MAKLEQSKVDMAFRMFYGEGKNLSGIAEEIGCGVENLSPWLLRAALQIKRETQEDADERITVFVTEIRRLEAENESLRKALVAATANLAGAASAYRKHAARHRSVGRAVADPFFATRADDFDRAAEQGRAAFQWTETDPAIQDPIPVVPSSMTVDAKDQRLADLESALEPFATFGANTVDEEGWSGIEQQASIHTWFGPSEFRAARDALGAKPDAE